MYVQIVDPNETFTWRPTDERTGEELQTTFTLRIVPEEVQDRLRRQFTTPDTWKRGRRIPGDLQLGKFTDACLDYAIVDWSQLYAVKRNGDGEIVERREVPCTSDAKRALPEWIRAEIVRLCVGKEAGMDDQPAGPTPPARRAGSADGTTDDESGGDDSRDP
jgi:hypothetical protein